MEILNTAMTWLMGRRMPHITYFMENPLQVQHELLLSLLRTAQDTEWGRKYEYRTIASWETFRERVPVSSYEEMYPYIHRMLLGQQNVLWPTFINQFSKSSGTTNARSKYIPVSAEALRDCHYRAGKDMLTLYRERNPDTKIFLGKSVGMGGSYIENPEWQGSLVGDVSAILMKNLPFWAESRRTPSLDIALMAEWEEKISRLVASVADESVTSLAGVPTWTLVLLQRILEHTGKRSIREVWPQLEVFFHGAVAFGPYRETFRTLLGPDTVFMETYNASEGYFGIQDTDSPDELLLLLDHGVYYEFLPLEELGSSNPMTINLSQVELGKNYAMVISTNAGLWRYLIGDTVRFTSLAPYRIKISGRTKHFINAFGEEVVIENADAAITEACRQTAAVVKDFTVAPIYLEAGKKGGHEWLIEFEQEPAVWDEFVCCLDDTLRSVNSDYDAKRYRDIALSLPVVRSLPKGTFYQWLARHNRLGGQYKVPRLSNHREYVDSILEMLQ